MTRILLVTTQRWPFVARLAGAFSRLGCHVDAICPSAHVLAGMHVLRRHYPYRLHGTLPALTASIADAAPDLILACDDTAIVRLCQLAQLLRQDPAGGAVANCIERSLGNSATCLQATRRGELMVLAREEKIRIPETAAIHQLCEIGDLLSRTGLPAVVKSSGTFGGVGVAVVHSAAEAATGFAAVHARPSWIRIIKRLIVNRDPSLLEQRRYGDLSDTIVQAFVPDSHPANRAVACWQGEVLAGISVLAVETAGATQPATIVEVIEHPEMTDAAVKIVRRLGLSGFCGLDFMLTRDRRSAYLIEVNPRATPISHLALGPGRDLPAAIVARLQSTPTPETVAITSKNEIALFPYAWLANPANPRLQSAYHDVPWEDADLIHACLAQPWREMSVWEKLRRGWRRPEQPALVPAGRFHV